ncbi:MAG TPA: alpha/beta fold hydrolase [Pyrinomonadaceae bacterium]|jgi:pimeloyl-ACP methyl ester carboxylesterase|nr:alpha/beta fold hydrolase [Pyrinomonadaceae bacterium]
MSPRRASGRKLIGALLPIILVIALAFVGLTAWLVYGATRPPRRPYLITPEGFRRLSDRGLRATEETWANRDGTSARGWLLRGTEGSAAVILLHRYGADRSWLLNLGVKLNEAMNVTVLLPDLRGHGENPPVEVSAFGATDAEDVLAAVDYLKSLKTPQGRALVGEAFGLYGVEAGAYASLLAAQKNPQVRALVLDSIPDRPDDVLGAAVNARTGLDNGAVRFFARLGTRVYFAGGYKNEAACTVAESLGPRQVLLLSGEDAGPLRQTTEALMNCFPPQTTREVQTNLPLTGVTLASASPEQGEVYDRRVIEFFDRALRGNQ